jgi:predicted kinase
VACDLAFLAMDLDERGFTGFAGYLVHAYARAADDRELARLMPFYKAYRAVVRGKVGSMAAAGMQPGTAREERRLEAMRYFQLAACYDLRPALILTCGLPATGKSHLARACARPLHAVVLRSDVRRKLISGIPLTRHAEQEYGSGAYSAERTEQTYHALLEDATAALRSGRSAIIDATFSSARLRAPFIDAAVRMDVPYWIVHLTAPEALVRERLARRATEPGEVSDADFSVYERARSTFEPPDEVAHARVLEIESGAEPAEESSALLIDRMIAAASVAHELS